MYGLSSLIRADIAPDELTYRAKVRVALGTREIRMWRLKDSPEDGTESSADIPTFKIASVSHAIFPSAT